MSNRLLHIPTGSFVYYGYNAFGETLYLIDLDPSNTLSCNRNNKKFIHVKQSLSLVEGSNVNQKIIKHLCLSLDLMGFATTEAEFEIV